MRDFQDTTTPVLKSLVSNLKADARSLLGHNKEEARRLFQLAKRVVGEIRYREFHFPAIAYQFN